MVDSVLRAFRVSAGKHEKDVRGFDTFLLILDVIIDIGVMVFLSKKYKYLMKNDLDQIPKYKKIYAIILIVVNLLLLLEILISSMFILLVFWIPVCLIEAYYIV